MSNELNLVYARFYSSPRTNMLDAPSSPNLDLMCAQQSGTALFCKNNAKLYFEAKQKRN